MNDNFKPLVAEETKLTYEDVNTAIRYYGNRILIKEYGCQRCGHPVRMPVVVTNEDAFIINWYIERIERLTKKIISEFNIPEQILLDLELDLIHTLFKDRPEGLNGIR